MADFRLENVIARLLDRLYDLLASLPLLLLALLIVYLGWLAGRWLSGRAFIGGFSKRNPLLEDVLRTSTRWLVTALAILLALETVEATAIVGAMLGTAGIVGIALGFAFKDTLENYLAGVLMSFRHPFSPRDEVVIDGEWGTVMALTSRATILMTPDGNHLRLPNARVFRAVILNYTRNPNRRFEFDVGIGVREDLLEARTLGLGELASLEGVMANPAPSAFIVALADSSVQVRYRGWVDQLQSDFWQVRSEAIRRVKLALEAAGLDMPEPTYRLQWGGAALPPAIEAHAPRAESPEPRPRKQAQCPPPDTRAHSELHEQIERETRISTEPNLLREPAPLE